MSFLDQIIEDREYQTEMQGYEEELVRLEEELNNLYEKAQALKEDATDFPESMSVGEIFDEAQKRMKTAKWAFGLTNKLKNPEDRKKHRRNIIIVMNKLRALINKLIQKLTVEVPAERTGSASSSRPGEGRMGTPRAPQQGTQSPGRGSFTGTPRPNFMT